MTNDVNGVGLELGEIGGATKRLLARAHEVLQSAPQEKTRAFAAAVPADIDEASTPRLVLCGQYSAGKSTILRALTGRDDIAVGAGITSDKPQTIEWNGVSIVDTPGIHTTLRPDHDELSYKEIGRADVVLFVTTTGLLDTVAASAFRRLAFDRQRADAMVLVVNKMSQAADGNTREARAVKREALADVLRPRTPETLPVVCIDAKDALAARDGGAIAARLRRESNLDELIEVMNARARDAGATSKLRQPLYALESALNDALAATGDDGSDTSKLEAHLVERRRRVLAAQEEARGKARRTVREQSARVRQKGREVAGAVRSGASETELQSLISQASREVERISDALPEKIVADLQPIFEALHVDLEKLNQNAVLREALRHAHGGVETALGGIDVSPAALHKAKVAARVGKEVAEWIAQQAQRPKLLPGLLGYRKTELHRVVKEVGAVLDTKFKPWQAARIARGIDKAGKVLGVVAAVGGVLIQIKEDLDARAAEDHVRSARVNITDEFERAASTIETCFDEKTGAYVATELSVTEIDEKLAALRAERASRDEVAAALSSLLFEARALIDRVVAVA